MWLYLCVRETNGGEKQSNHSQTIHLALALVVVVYPTEAGNTQKA